MVISTHSVASESILRVFQCNINSEANAVSILTYQARAKLQLSPCQGGLFRAILNRFATADLSKCEPQHVANTLQSLVTLELFTVGLIDPATRR